MREILEGVERWRGEAKAVALATVVQVWGSAPRPPGSKMAISSAGEMIGSVSGGCVEGAVFQEAQEVLRTGEPRLLTFGVTDDEAWAVGLSCGGEIQVFLEAVPPPSAPSGALLGALWEAIAADRAAALATVVAGPGVGRQLLVFGDGSFEGSVASSDVDEEVRQRARACLEESKASRFAATSEKGELDVFVEVHRPRPQLILVGAVHTAIPLITFARELGFETIVVDPRGTFATAERFAHADQLLREWPQDALPKLSLHEETYLATLSHDPKIDLPALKVVLPKPVRYIGALGSKKTHGKRVAALQEAGFSPEVIARIHAPIGLDLGGRRPEEIALAVIAEIVAARHGRSGSRSG